MCAFAQLGKHERFCWWAHVSQVHAAPLHCRTLLAPLPLTAAGSLLVPPQHRLGAD